MSSWMRTRLQQILSILVSYSFCMHFGILAVEVTQQGDLHVIHVFEHTLEDSPNDALFS